MGVVILNTNSPTTNVDCAMFGSYIYTNVDGNGTVVFEYSIISKQALSNIVLIIISGA